MGSKSDSSAPAHDPRTEDEHPHGCYEGWVYLGYIGEDDHGEEVETFEAVPCRRCADKYGRGRRWKTTPVL